MERGPAAQALEEAFEGLRELHAGRTSIVIKGIRRRDGAVVALKLYKPGEHARAASEARLLRSLCLHVNVGSLLQVIDVREQQCLVLQYYPHDLSSLIRSHPSGMQPMDVKHLAAQLLLALDALHSRQVAHLAIKPKSIMLEGPGLPMQANLVKLTQLKYAQQLGAKGHAPVDVRPASMMWYDAPELLAGDVCTSATDIWSFGCVLAEMLIGRPLFSGSKPASLLAAIVAAVGAPTQHLLQVMRRDPGLRDLSIKLPDLASDTNRIKVLPCDEEMRQVLVACLRVDPAMRPSARQLLSHAFRGIVTTPWFSEQQRRHEQQQQQWQQQQEQEQNEEGGRSQGVAQVQTPEKGITQRVSAPGSDGSPASEGRVRFAEPSDAWPSPGGNLYETETRSKRSSSSGRVRPVKKAILAMPGLASRPSNSQFELRQIHSELFGGTGPLVPGPGYQRMAGSAGGQPPSWLAPDAQPAAVPPTPPTMPPPPRHRSVSESGTFEQGALAKASAVAAAGIVNAVAQAWGVTPVAPALLTQPAVDAPQWGTSGSFGQSARDYGRQVSIESTGSGLPPTGSRRLFRGLSDASSASSLMLDTPGSRHAVSHSGSPRPPEIPPRHTSYAGGRPVTLQSRSSGGSARSSLNGRMSDASFQTEVGRPALTGAREGEAPSSMVAWLQPQPMEQLSSGAQQQQVQWPAISGSIRGVGFVGGAVAPEQNEGGARASYGAGPMASAPARTSLDGRPGTQVMGAAADIPSSHHDPHAQPVLITLGPQPQVMHEHKDLEPSDACVARPGSAISLAPARPLSGYVSPPREGQPLDHAPSDEFLEPSLGGMALGLSFSFPVLAPGQAHASEFAQDLDQDAGSHGRRTGVRDSVAVPTPLLSKPQKKGAAQQGGLQREAVQREVVQQEPEQHHTSERKAAQPRGDLHPPTLELGDKPAQEPLAEKPAATEKARQERQPEPEVEAPPVPPVLPCSHSKRLKSLQQMHLQEHLLDRHSNASSLDSQDAATRDSTGSDVHGVLNWGAPGGPAGLDSQVPLPARFSEPGNWVSGRVASTMLHEPPKPAALERHSHAPSSSAAAAAVLAGSTHIAATQRGSESGLVQTQSGAASECGSDTHYGLLERSSGSGDMADEVARLRGRVKALQLGGLKGRQMQRHLEKKLIQEQTGATVRRQATMPPQQQQQVIALGADARPASGATNSGSGSGRAAQYMIPSPAASPAKPPLPAPLLKSRSSSALCVPLPLLPGKLPPVQPARPDSGKAGKPAFVGDVASGGCIKVPARGSTPLAKASSFKATSPARCTDGDGSGVKKDRAPSPQSSFHGVARASRIPSAPGVMTALTAQQQQQRQRQQQQQQPSGLAQHQLPSEVAATEPLSRLWQELDECSDVQESIDMQQLLMVLGEVSS